jgi:hypothetical protein
MRAFVTRATAGKKLKSTKDKPKASGGGGANTTIFVAVVVFVGCYENILTGRDTMVVQAVAIC